MDPSTLLPGVGIVLVAGVLLWFAFGTQVNVRKGNQVMRWLQDGLAVLGPRTTVRWLGSSVVELQIVQARPPWRVATVLIVLEPRDLGVLWALSQRRGRRDFLLVRLNLISAPRHPADLIAPRSWTARDRRADDTRFDHEESWVDGAGNEVRLRYDKQTDLAALRTFWDRLDRQSGGAWRISVRSLVPHLEVHLLVPSLKDADARAMVETIRELGEAVAAAR